MNLNNSLGFNFSFNLKYQQLRVIQLNHILLLRKLENCHLKKKEIRLNLPSHRFVFVERDSKIDCDIYAIRLTLDEMPEWKE